MSRDSASRSTWRMICVTTALSLLSLGAVTITLQRAVAQSSDSAQTIEDDPTVAPDPEESADNSVSFPIDI